MQSIPGVLRLTQTHVSPEETTYRWEALRAVRVRLPGHPLGEVHLTAGDPAPDLLTLDLPAGYRLEAMLEAPGPRGVPVVRMEAVSDERGSSPGA